MELEKKQANVQTVSVKISQWIHGWNWKKKTSIQTSSPCWNCAVNPWMQLEKTKIKHKEGNRQSLSKISVLPPMKLENVEKQTSDKQSLFGISEQIHGSGKCRRVWDKLDSTYWREKPSGKLPDKIIHCFGSLNTASVQSTHHFTWVACGIFFLKQEMCSIVFQNAQDWLLVTSHTGLIFTLAGRESRW